MGATSQSPTASPDSTVRRTGRLESLPHARQGGQRALAANGAPYLAGGYSTIRSSLNPPMPSAAIQLRLLPSARPLDDRLGGSFFRQIPHQPGVYRMFGAEGRLLYVGKAGDLRQRLTSYRSLAHASRKTIRLLHLVRSITWEVCATEEQATLRENDLLRTHRPRFNRMGVWPDANGYLELSVQQKGLRLRFTRPSRPDPPDESGRPREPVLWPDPAAELPAPPAKEANSQTTPDLVGASCSSLGHRPRVFGAFKPGARLAGAALVRLLWGLGEDWPEPRHLPRSLLKSDGSACDLPRLDHRTTGLLLAYLEGSSPELLNVCSGFAESPGSPFLREYWRNAWDQARQFYVTGPARNRALRTQFGGAGSLLGLTELDDLTVRWRRSMLD